MAVCLGRLAGRMLDLVMIRVRANVELKGGCHNCGTTLTITNPGHIEQKRSRALPTLLSTSCSAYFSGRTQRTDTMS